MKHYFLSYFSRIALILLLVSTNIAWAEAGSYKIYPDGRLELLNVQYCDPNNGSPYYFRVDRETNFYVYSTYTSTGDNVGTITFNLSEISKNLVTGFYIEVYKIVFGMILPEDRPAYTTYFQALPVPTLSEIAYIQLDSAVVLKWNASNKNYNDGWWIIYRDGSKIAEVPQGTYTYKDTTVPFESKPKYTIYYVMNDWDRNTQVSALKSNEKSVDTERHVPMLNRKIQSLDDRIVFTWKTDSFPTSFGAKFNIYCDDELIDSVSPNFDGQTTFRWEHRSSTGVHTDRQRKRNGDTCWVEEPLYPCKPHNYRIEGAIHSIELKERWEEKKASIQVGTLFSSFDASKALYAGQVKLSWHVNADTLKNYIIERRRAEHDNEAWVVLDRISSANQSVIYTDDTALPGVYYDYKVTVEDKCSDGTIFYNSASDIGFAKATGTVSGRVTYGSSGMAVKGVDVVAHQTNSNEDSDHHHAVQFKTNKGHVIWEYPSADYAANIFKRNDWSIQMWISANKSVAQNFIQIADNCSIGMNAKGQPTFVASASTLTFNSDTLRVGEYSHLTLTRRGTHLTAYLITLDANGLAKMDTAHAELPSAVIDVAQSDTFKLGGFVGFMDEFRLWTKCLTEEEIWQNYDRLIVGNEKGMETYWTFDEGLEYHAFDYARDGSVYKSHHCLLGIDVTSVEHIPSQLDLRATTDSVGNYIINGVPFSGTGTTYAIVPTLGIHQFNPTQQLRYVSASSLVHNGTDFDDVSSFPVSGRIYYENTDYPVEGCNFYVDGTICAKDGEMVASDADGRFSISVPIGEHYIQVKKNGHEFANAGRYPADPEKVGTRHNFDRRIDGLEFKDATLVNFTGRVAGGKIEGDTAIGFGRSHNNIGMATITMRPSDTRYRLNVVEEVTGTVVSYENNPNELPVASASPDTIKSKAWRGKGDNCNKITIRTDSLTGEFSALVPPLDYTVDSINVHSAGLKLLDNPMAVDLTNPLVTYTDSVKDDQDTAKMRFYEYHALLRKTYHSAPVFTVAQDDNEIGAFGISSYQINDGVGKLTVDSIYYADQQGKVRYRFNAPIFEMEENYSFDIAGYELYENKEQHLIDTVPLANTTVTISNGLSAEQPVYLQDTLDIKAGSIYQMQDVQLTLDSAGKVNYTWKAGLPNPVTPYTRTLNIYYDIDGVNHDWSGNALSGIILGDLPTGNNFVTAGPDKVEMILRDPPGSQSFATWETGTITNYSRIEGWVYDGDQSVTTNTYLGTTTGTLFGGVGIGTIIEQSYKNNVVVGLETKIDKLSATTYKTQTSVTKAISTSDLPEYDGADGDVYIGQATNFIFGLSRQVGIYRDTLDATKVSLYNKDAFSTGFNFSTAFTYTQRFIEHTLIPEWRALRRSLLKTVPDTAAYKSTSDSLEYVTTYNASDPDFAKQGTYRIVKPNGFKGGGDTILYINEQIRVWEDYLAMNEEDKVLAHQKKDTKDVNFVNRSFDAGTTTTISKSRTISNGDKCEWTAKAGGVLGDDFGFSIAKTGMIVEARSHDLGGEYKNTEHETAKTTTFSYTLKDNDVDDAITVDVYEFDRHFITYKQWKKDHNKGKKENPYKELKLKDQDSVLVGEIGYYPSPIFRTLGGKTSNPYEGEVRTKYIQPDTVIMEATAQIEVPRISVVNPRVNGITSGTAANYELHLTNLSEVGADCYFRLLVADNTDSLGAMILIDGAPLNSGRTIKVPVGETLVKRMQLLQTDVSILNFEGIAIVLASIGQSDPKSKMPVIADTARIWAQFEPSSSPVTLQLSTDVINTNTGSDLMLTTKDFDRYYKGLKAFRLQYKPQGGSWTQFHEYVLKDSLLNGKNMLLPTDRASIEYTLPMAGKSDGEYTFRIVSVTDYGGKEIYVYSEELPLVKDMYKPRALGLPEPADGILDIGDELSVTFNEPILTGDLTNTKNFLVTGVLNGDPVDHAVSLQANAGIAAPAAQTEANINLSGRDFSLDAWLNIHGEGALLTHGTGKQKMTIGTNASGQLVVAFVDSVFTSQAALPRDKWMFLTLSRKAVGNSGEMSIAVAYDDVTQTLFSGKPVPLYYGNGPLSVGCGAAAAIHELLLWDEARNMETALSQRAVTKSPATRHLIGYWKMNEGEGKTIRDYARNRHMAMSGETWYLNNVNKAVALTDGQQLKLNTSAVSIQPDDDYALEFWVKTAQATETQLLQLGKISLLLKAEGQLALLSDGAVLSTTNDQTVNDNTWHHVALNVLRLGTAALYIDGIRTLTVPADTVAEFGSAYLTLGGSFTGMVDEIRLWSASMNANQLARNRKVRLNGDEPGLALYYPFEQKTLDEYNQVVVNGTGKEMTGLGEDALISGQSSVITYSDDAPALREKRTETNVPFSYTASDTKIVLSLDADPAKVEGCTLNFTVRNVRDRNGNNSVPATWSAFVHRGELAWADDEMNIEQRMESGSSFTATLINRSGSSVIWTLGTLPTWLSASAETGTLSPTAQTNITFAVSETTPIGKYEQTIYAMGSNGIEIPLTLHLTVKGNVPDWSVNASDYAYSMDVIGQLQIFGVSSDDPDDIVAAFIDDECRGVAHPEYKARYDGYYFTLTIFGETNNNENNKDIIFRVYDASTGITYSQATPDRELTYKALSMIGRYDDPVILNVEDMIEQQTVLRKGWNWLSVGVTTEDMSPKAILSKVEDDVLIIKGQSMAEGLLQHDSLGHWYGDMDTLRNNKMYKVLMRAERNLRLVGKRVSPQECFVSVLPEWNWIGYYEQQRMTLADALAAMSPSNGDIIRAQRAVSYFDDYEWVGSLLYMEPGQGYTVYNSKEAKQFAYPYATVGSGSHIRRNIPAAVAAKTENIFTPVSATAYPFNMILIAHVHDSGKPIANSELGVFAGNECRAAGMTDDEGFITMMIPGEDPVKLTFKVVDNGEVREADEKLDYETDAIVGSYTYPFEIEFGEHTGIDDILDGDTRTVKILRNGILYILRNGRIFNAQGIEVK